MKSTGFQFKPFFIRHDKCAMKVNTDGILLGAIANVAGAKKVLDLGTGTGLVALMIAQRNEDSQITALELEPNAFQQAQENVQHSSWSNRIQVLQGDVLAADFVPVFDLIVTNPPYFADSLASRSNERDLARAATQSHLAWLLKAKDWLSEQGEITLILPFEAGEKLITQASASGLFCTKICKIITKTGQAPKRMVVSFTRQPQPKTESELVIYDDNNRYTDAFKALTQAFYLKM